MTRAKTWTHTFQCTLTGTPSRVFSALTDAGELRRWFAEHVEIDPRAGGNFRFWGKHTYGLIDRPLADRHITRIEPDRRFAFEWPFDGVDSEVTLNLSSEEPATDTVRTHLSLSHAFSAHPNVRYSEELVDDLWRLTLGNLEAHLRGGDGIVLPDFTNPTQEIRLSIVIDAPRARVFRALIDPKALNRWIATAAEVEPRTGGKYTYAWKYAHNGRMVEGGPTRILDFVKDERLVTDWTDWRGDETRPLTRVAWLLADVDGGRRTRLTLVHGGFSRAADQGDYPFGWRDFLERLKRDVQSAV